MTCRLSRVVACGQLPQGSRPEYVYATSSSNRYIASSYGFKLCTMEKINHENKVTAVNEHVAPVETVRLV